MDSPEKCCYCGAGRDNPQRYADSTDYLCGSILGRISGWHQTLRCAEAQVGQFKSHQVKLERIAEAANKIKNRWGQYYPAMTREYLDPEEFEMYESLESWLED